MASVFTEADFTEEAKPRFTEADFQEEAKPRFTESDFANDFKDLSAGQPVQFNPNAGRITPPGMTTAGGPRAPLASYAETAESLQEADTPLARFIAPRPTLTEPRVTLPKPSIPPEAGFLKAAGLEAVGALEGLPEFFTSDAGVLSMLGAKLAPRLVSAGFSADLTLSAFQQAKQAYQNWGKMTPAEKGKATVDVLASTLLGGLTGAHAAGVKLPSLKRPEEPGFIGPIATGESLPMPRGSPAWRRPAFQLPDVPKFEQTKPVEPEAPPVVTQGPPPVVEARPPEPAIGEAATVGKGKEGVGKEPWEMTRAEAVGEYQEPFSVKQIQEAEKKATGARSRFNRRTGPMVPPSISGEISDKISKQEATVEEMRQAYRQYVDDYKRRSTEHYEAVQRAVKQGKPVPPEVLADYPDLQPKAPQPSTPPPPIYKSIEGAKVEQGVKPTIPVWKVSYTDLETRAAKRPFFKHTAEVEAPTRKEAIEKVQAYHGNPSKWGEFRASKAPEGTKPMSMFRHIPEEPLPPTTPPPAAAKVQTEVAKPEGEVAEPKAPYSVSFESPSGGRETVTVSRVKFNDLPDQMKKLVENEMYHASQFEEWKDYAKWEKVKQGKTPITLWEKKAGTEVSHNISLDPPEVEFGRWATREDLYDKEFNPAGQSLRDKLIGEREAAEKAKQEKEAAERAATEKQMAAFREYEQEISKVALPTGKKTTITIENKAGEKSQLSGTAYGPWMIDKRTGGKGKYAQPTVYKVTHIPSGLGISGEGMTSLEQAKNYVRALIHSGVRSDWKKPEDLSKAEHQALLEVARAWAAGGEVPKYFKAEPTPAPPAATGEGMPPGPGAQTAGTDQPTGAQIEQLSQAFRQITAEKTPFLQKVKEAFDLGKKRELSQNLIARTLSALKTSGDYLIQTWQGQRQLDPILRAKGELSAELETRGWRLRQAMKDMKRAVSSKAVREAISKYVDAGGDVEKLRQSAESVPAGRRAPYIRAMQLTPDEKIIAGHIRSFFDARLQEAIDAGVLSHGVEDYLHRIYPKDTTWRRGVINAVQNALLDTRTPGLAKQRVFQLDAEAERAGHLPVNDFIPRIIDYEASLSNVIASRASVKRFTEIKMPDGRPMLDVSGIGVPIENAEGIREATLIKPSFRPGEKQLDDSGKPTKNYRLDYQSRDYPALKKWKWATNDAEGKPIFVQGDVLVHPDAVHRVDALLEPSKVKRYAAARAALTVGSVFKQTMLDFSGFHQVQIAIHGLEHKVNPFRLVKDVDTNNPDIQGLLKGGMTLGGQHVGGIYEEGLAGRSLSRQIPGLGELMQSYHDWLFQDFIPRVKTTMAIHALERNKARFAKELASGQMKPEALYHQTAKEANAAFGEQNYIMLERSKTAQDMARLILLAPDFLESRARFALQAGTRLGGEQRMALLLGALTLYTTARIMNKAINDEWHFEPENMFSVIYNGKSYSVRTVQGDILHLMESPVRFWMHRLNPTITRPLFELMTQRDEFGRKRSFWQVLGDTISNVVPISMRNSREQSIWTSMLNAFGGAVRRDSDVGRVYQEAAKWKAKNGIRTEPGEFIYDSSKDVYRPLKLALLDGNTEGAAKEYQKLIASKVVTPSQAIRHFQSYANAPFSGSKANEQRFVQSLTKDQRHAYEGAKQEKQRVLREFLKARQLVPGSQGTIPSFVPTVQQR